jgi:hypothetical protein
MLVLCLLSLFVSVQGSVGGECSGRRWHSARLPVHPRHRLPRRQLYETLPRRTIRTGKLLLVSTKKYGKHTHLTNCRQHTCTQLGLSRSSFFLLLLSFFLCTAFEVCLFVSLLRLTCRLTNLNHLYKLNNTPKHHPTGNSGRRIR